MHTLRTRFARDIVTEFLPPARPTKKQKVIIFADGMPSVPNKKLLLETFSKKGFWVFHPRYRGSWESDGKFLAKSPHLDVIDVIDGIHKNFKSLWHEMSGYKDKPFKLNPEQIILIGSSFAGPAMILASRDKRVSKVMAFSPVIDWQKTGKLEPLSLLAKFTEEAFGNGYRTIKDGWKKLRTGKFYNPAHHVKEIDGKKLFIVHAQDDEICPYPQTKKFCLTTGTKLITLKKGGHLGSALLLTPRFIKEFTKFIKT